MEFSFWKLLYGFGFVLFLFLIYIFKHEKLDKLKRIYSLTDGATDLQGVVMGCREFITKEMGGEVLGFYYLSDTGTGLFSDLLGEISLFERNTPSQALFGREPQKLKGSSEEDKELIKKFGPDTWFIPLDMNRDDKSNEPLRYRNDECRYVGVFAIKGKNISKIHRHLRQVRGIVRSAVLCQKAAEFSTRDSITRLYSDRGYWMFLEQQFAIALKETNYPISICLLSIDGFPAFCESHCRNDRDILLIELASLLSDVLRDSDIIARSKGGTFCVIFPPTVKDKALQLMEEVRLTVQGHLFHRDMSITISAGVSGYPDDMVEDFNSLHANAERALSEAITYRNTVVAHSPQTVDTSAIKI